MKTAISVPDEIFEAAEEMAEELGVSRSQFYSQAVEDYVAQHRDEAVTAKLNEVYAEDSGSVDPALERLQALSAESSDW